MVYDDEKLGPFGDTDAARARSVETIERVGSEGFVSITTAGKSGILNTDERRFRVLVGKKGSGKTLYLRRSYIRLKEDSVYKENFNNILESVVQTRPQTELILRFSQMFNGEFLTEKWRELWRRAIIRTFVTHILYSGKLDHIKKELPKKFSARFGKILSKAKCPINIFSQVIEIINSVNTGRDFNRFCDDILWAEVDYILGELIRDAKPIYFYIDAIDEEYQHAPMYWMRAQKGLFYCVMQFLRDERFGGKLHVIISIRDHVYSSILQSEHETRYFDRNHISILKWNAISSQFLLEQKLKYLDSKYFLMDGVKDAYHWVGAEYIENNVRSVKEPFVRYLIRHTRAIPRDIIMIGNDICDIVLKAKEGNLDQKDFEIKIKMLISNNAKRFADEQLLITSNHLTSNMMPSMAVELGIDQMYVGGYTGEQEYLNLSILYKSKIIQIIKKIGRDRFSNDDLLFAKVYAKEIFEIDSDLNVFDVLWQNGLIGYSYDNEYSVFFDEESTDFVLPMNKSGYVFHSILIDRLDLIPVGAPVNIKYSEYL